MNLEIGDRFGMLVVSELPAKFPDGRWKVPCTCDCGKFSTPRRETLKVGSELSCGCIRYKRAAEKVRTHGQTGTPTYHTWESMNSRCYTPSNGSYVNYGGRGIEVCSRWRGSEGFLNFRDDMGDRPEGLTLDRIDVSKGYSPDNCRWADGSTQCYNTRQPKNNTSGRVGVVWDKGRGRYTASITKDYKLIHLGRFKNFEDAVKARESAEIKYFGVSRHD